jgi:O-antigen/teichoic acid export membrane protein
MSESVPVVDPNKGPLPEGTVPVGIGLVISGVSAYVFLAVTKRALDTDPYQALSALWAVTFVLAPGCFLPVEQEVGRALAHRRALGQGGAPVVRRAAMLFAGIMTIVVVGLLATSTLLRDHLLHDSWPLVVGLILGVVGFGCTYLLRGLLSGNALFKRFGILLGLDGIIRVGVCAVMAVAGVEAPGAYALLVGMPPIIAIAVAAFGAGELLKPGPPTNWNEIAPNMGWLLAGSLLAAGLVNAGPLAANLLSNSDESKLVTDFFAAVLIARLPLFMFQAVQAALLPRLAQLAAQRELVEFKIRLRRLMIVVAAIGALGVAGAAALGPWVLEVFFDATLTRRTMTLLALGSGLYMMAVALAQAVIALESHARVAIGWFIAVLAFVGVTAVASQDLLLRVEIGLMVSSAVAFAIFFVTVQSLLERMESPLA